MIGRLVMGNMEYCWNEWKENVTLSSHWNLSLCFLTYEITIVPCF